MELHPQYGEIYLVNFEPSVGHEYQKVRPAVVVQSSSQLKNSNLITLIPLSSKVDKKRQEDILVEKTKANKLYVDSLLKVHSIMSFDKSRFIKKIGTMDDEILTQIKKYLKVHFDL